MLLLDRIEICKGVPSHECGLAVHSSSYFDRLWRQGGTSARYVLVLTKIPRSEYWSSKKKDNSTTGAVDNTSAINAAVASTDAAMEFLGDKSSSHKEKRRKRTRPLETMPGSAADLLQRNVMPTHLPGNILSLTSLDSNLQVEDAWSALLNDEGSLQYTSTSNVSSSVISKNQNLQKTHKSKKSREDLLDENDNNNHNRFYVDDAEPRTAVDLDPHFSDSDGSSDDSEILTPGSSSVKGNDDWAEKKAKRARKKKRREKAPKLIRRKPRGPQRNNTREFRRQAQLRHMQKQYNNNSNW